MSEKKVGSADAHEDEDEEEYWARMEDEAQHLEEDKLESSDSDR